MPAPLQLNLDRQSYKWMRQNLQHQEVRDNKLGSVKKSTDKLLVQFWSVTIANSSAARSRLSSSGSGLGIGLRRSATALVLVVRDSEDNAVLSVLAHEKAIVLFDGAAEKLEKDAEEDDADAGAGEHALAGDVPGGGDKACVDGVPVPKHLAMFVSFRWF